MGPPAPRPGFQRKLMLEEGTMQSTSRLGGLALALLGAALLTVGCGRADKPRGQAKAKPAQPQQDHSGWWCDEHGIPEEECSMCSGKVAAEFKKKGDWCEEHDRAKSQCFLCDPSLRE